MNSYRVAGHRAAVLSGLQARPAGTAAFRTPHPVVQNKQHRAGAAAAALAVTARYEVCWQVKAPVETLPASRKRAAQPRRTARLSRSDGSSTMSLFSFSQRAGGPSLAADAFDSCQRTLHFVQQHMQGELHDMPIVWFM
jgi:hypothetical protein